MMAIIMLIAGIYVNYVLGSSDILLQYNDIDLS